MGIIDENIKNVFDNMSYSEQYNYDIWFTIIVIIIVLVLTIYFYIDNFIKSQRPNWKNNKCNPLYMPFADSLADNKGSLNDGSGNFAEENFNECLNDLTYGISLDAKQPINIIFGIFKNMFAFLASIVSQIVAFFMYLLNLIFELFNTLVERLKLILHQVNIVLIRGNTFLQNVIYTLQDIYFTLLVCVDLLKTLALLSLNVMASTFLVGGIVQFSSILGALSLHIILAMIFSSNPFTWPVGLYQWGMVALQLVIFLTATAILIIAILLNFKVIEFNKEIEWKEVGGGCGYYDSMVRYFDPYYWLEIREQAIDNSYNIPPSDVN